MNAIFVLFVISGAIILLDADRLYPSMWPVIPSMRSDNRRLSDGANLIYAFVGSDDYLSWTIEKLKADYESSNYGVKSWKCMDITDGAISQPMISFRDRHDTEDDNRVVNIVAVYNVHNIAVSELKRLDFLFQVNDRITEQTSTVVALLWSTDTRPFTVEETEEHSDLNEMSGQRDFRIKDFLATEWSKGGPLVNGDALAGRIAGVAQCLDCSYRWKEETLLNGNFSSVDISPNGGSSSSRVTGGSVETPRQQPLDRCLKLKDQLRTKHLPVPRESKLKYYPIVLLLLPLYFLMIVRILWPLKVPLEIPDDSDTEHDPTKVVSSGTDDVAWNAAEHVIIGAEAAGVDSATNTGPDFEPVAVDPLPLPVLLNNSSNVNDIVAVVGVETAERVQDSATETGIDNVRSTDPAEISDSDGKDNNNMMRVDDSGEDSHSTSSAVASGSDSTYIFEDSVIDDDDDDNGDSAYESEVEVVESLFVTPSKPSKSLPRTPGTRTSERLKNLAKRS